MDSAIALAILGGLAVIYIISSNTKSKTIGQPPYPTGTPPGVTTGPTLEQAGYTAQDVLNQAGITTGPEPELETPESILEDAGITTQQSPSSGATTGPTYEPPADDQPYPAPAGETDDTEKKALERFISQHRGTPEGRMAEQRYQMLYGTDSSSDYLESIFGR
jgi:hypothetical protein